VAERGGRSRRHARACLEAVAHRSAEQLASVFAGGCSDLFATQHAGDFFDPPVAVKVLEPTGGAISLLHLGNREVLIGFGGHLR